MSPIEQRAGLGILMAGLQRRWRRLLDHVLAEAGFNDATWPPLLHLAITGDGINQTELAARVGLDGSSLVRLLDLMETRGLIERRAGSEDRRTKLIFLTPDGHAAARDIRTIIMNVEADILADIDDTEIAMMTDAAFRIDDRIQTYNGR
jgi:MarR family transcriptional regulator, transcriptional regulator for hemolysin